jgi:hypothetical protein
LCKECLCKGMYMQVFSKTFWKCSLKPSNSFFSLTNRISYERLHLQLTFETLLRLLRLKFRPLEVTELQGSRQENIYSNFQNFELHTSQIS